MLRSVLFLISVATILSSNAIAAGSSVRVRLNDNTLLSGELLSVQSVSFVIAIEPWSSQNERTGDVSGVRVIQVKDVQELHVNGKSVTPFTVLGGMIAGAGIAAVVLTPRTHVPLSHTVEAVLDQTSPSNTIFAGIAIVVAGGTVGYFVGEVISRPSQDFTDFTDDEIQKLKQLSRYPEREPQFLRDLSVALNGQTQ